jgi:hypothetical protein
MTSISSLRKMAVSRGALISSFILLPFHAENRHHDVAADDNAFLATPREDKHAAPPCSFKLLSGFQTISSDNLSSGALRNGFRKTGGIIFLPIIGPGG